MSKEDDLNLDPVEPSTKQLYLSCKKFAMNLEECIDNVREALGLESTHYLVIADQVADVVKERDKLKKEILLIKKELKKILNLTSSPLTEDTTENMVHEIAWKLYKKLGKIRTT